MSSFSQSCPPGQPEYSKKKLFRLCKQSKSILPAESLINSPPMEGDAGGGGSSGSSIGDSSDSALSIRIVSSRTFSSFSGSKRGSAGGSAGKKEKSELNLPYLLRRVSAKNEVRQ